MIGASRLRRALRRWVPPFAVLALGVLGLGCRRVPLQADGQEHAPEPHLAAGAFPVDHLGEGELLEGPAQAFGVALPRGISVDSAFARAVLASGRGSVASLTKYLQARLVGGEFRDGPESATFEHVQSPAQPGADLRVQIRSWGSGVTVEFRDVTLQPAPDLPNEAARWRQVGLTPDGKLADPAHLD
jgi:hypothetical protein